MKKFFLEVLDGNNSTSAKRLVTLIMTLHFIIASFAILFVVIYLIFYLPKGRVDKDLLDVLKDILAHDMYVILAGFGFIGAENFGKMLIEREAAKRPMDPYNMFNQGYPPVEDPNKPNDI